MTFIAVRCPSCQSDQIVKRGKTARGTQRYVCQNTLWTGGVNMAITTFETLPALGSGGLYYTAGLTACHHTPYSVVVVLGHPHYYPRFGFAPAKPLGIVWEHDAPDEAFLVKEIHEGALAQIRGVVKYRPEFATV